MKKSLIVLIIILAILIILGFMGWQFLFKKSTEGETCQQDNDCQEGLHCIMNICSSGKQNSSCQTYKDCQSGLLCKNSICVGIEIPPYADYFEKIELQKMKPNMPPGPDNIPVTATEFKVGDAMNINLIAKSGVSGTAYFTIINAVTGETAVNYPEFQMYGSMGRGFSVPSEPAEYELKIYFNNELVHTIEFKVTY